MNRQKGNNEYHADHDEKDDIDDPFIPRGFWDSSIDEGIIVDLSNNTEDTLSIFSGAGFKWSPNGEQLIGYDIDGFYVTNLDGTNKWYLEPQ